MTRGESNECEVYEPCPSKVCEQCAAWYRAYVQECVKRGFKPTLLKSRQFSSIEIGAEMTREEAAKELGVSKVTIDTYLSKGKLKANDNGGVDDESVQQYKEERKKNLALSGRNIKEPPKPIDEANREIDNDDTEYIVTRGEIKEALKVAKELGYKEGYAACKKELQAKKIDRKQLLELIS